MEERVFQGIKDQISSTVQGYPFKRRAGLALETCVVLLVATLNWKFGLAMTISICSSSVAFLFDLKGKWFMFFLGIGIGNLLLYVSR